MREHTILLERPYGIGGDGDYINHYDKSELLPAFTRQRGFQLVSIEFGHDPYVIYDKFGFVIYQWPCGVVPDWLEVHNACQRLNII